MNQQQEEKMTFVDKVTDYWALITRKHQVFLDKWTIYPRERWGVWALTLLLFGLRVYLT